MPNVTVRGLDYSTLLRIRSKARQRGISVNRLIIETLQREYAAGDQAFNDLNALVGAWSKAEAAVFAAAVAPFAENDAGSGS